MEDKADDMIKPWTETIMFWGNFGIVGLKIRELNSNLSDEMVEDWAGFSSDILINVTLKVQRNSL